MEKEEKKKEIKENEKLLEQIKNYSEERLEEWKTTPLKIAVTGQSGTGRKLKLCNIHIYIIYIHIYIFKRKLFY